MHKIDKAGLSSEVYNAGQAAGAEGELKFLNIIGFADKGGHRDNRKKG